MEKRRLDISIREWLEESKSKAVKTLTYDRLLISLKLMEKYVIANTPVNEMTTRSIQKYLNELVEDGYSMSTIRKQFNLITAYWKWAMSQGLAANPIYMGVNLPSESRITKPKREIEAYSHREQKLLMDRLMTLKKEQYGAAILMMEEGLRVGEALALLWDDIRWGSRAIDIHQTLIRKSTDNTTFVQNTAKSKHSKRIIPLSANALDILSRLESNKQFGDYVFSRPDNPKMPYSYSSVEFHIKQLCKDLGISYKGLHAFRHTFATNCYERGCDVKILSKLLGHADVAITYNIYIHLYGNELEAMRKVIG